MEFTAHAALEMPRGQDRLDHLPAGIGRLRFERRGRAQGFGRPPELDLRKRLRAAGPALGVVDHLGSDHAHDQENHPPVFPQERPTGLPRSSTGLINMASVRTTATQNFPNRRR